MGGNNLMGKTNEKESIARVKKFICIMDSMTDEELDGIKPISHSRMVRIAKGSGALVPQVDQMLEEFKRMKTMIEKMGKAKLGKGNDMQNLMRNPQQLSKLKGVMDPRMMQQFGGMDGLMDMMKGMGKMEGMPDMADMMKQMKGMGGRR